jgi:hypothetical protein
MGDELWHYVGRPLSLLLFSVGQLSLYIWNFLMSEDTMCIHWVQLYNDITHMPAIDIFRHQQSLSDDNQVFLTLSNIDAEMSMTHMTSKTCTYTSEAILTLSSTYTLKIQHFPPICDDPLQLCALRELSTLSMSSTSLSIPTHQSLEIPVCPLPNPPFCFPDCLICSILAPDYDLRSFSFYCLTYHLSIARYSFMYLIFITYAHFPLSLYTSVSLVVILWLIMPVLPII